jgi:hypothetical protein
MLCAYQERSDDFGFLPEGLLFGLRLQGMRRRGQWCSFGPVDYATLEWVDWFGNRCRLDTIGAILPSNDLAGKIRRAQWRCPAPQRDRPQ